MRMSVSCVCMYVGAPMYECNTYVCARVSLMCARVYISFVFIQVASTNVACKPVKSHDDTFIILINCDFF